MCSVPSARNLTERWRDRPPNPRHRAGARISWRPTRLRRERGGRSGGATTGPRPDHVHELADRPNHLELGHGELGVRAGELLRTEGDEHEVERVEPQVLLE